MRVAGRFVARVLAAFVAAVLLSAAPIRGQETGSLSGLVYDSVLAVPIPGATVQMTLRGGLSLLNEVADSAGHFEFRALPPGDYLLGFFAPELQAYGIRSAPVLALHVSAGDRLEAWVAVPSAAALARAHCGPLAPNDSTAMLMGRVTDADAGTPLRGARVFVSWFELVMDGRGLHDDRQTLSAGADDAGFYRICGVPSDVPVAVEGAIGTRRSGLLEISVPPRGALRQDVLLGDSLSVVAVNGPPADTGLGETRLLRGRARLAGEVRDSAGRPLEGAFVTVPGTGLSARTAADGSFALATLPAGTFSLEARMIGMSPAVRAVHLVSDRTTRASLVLQKQPPQLAQVTVYGKSRNAWRNRGIQGFLRRKEIGLGRYLTRDQIEGFGAVKVSDILQRVPGVTARYGPQGTTITVRGNCEPTVFVDGAPVPIDLLDSTLSPNLVGAVEVYREPAFVPSEFFGGGSGCAAIGIWTTR